MISIFTFAAAAAGLICLCERIACRLQPAPVRSRTERVGGLIHISILTCLIYAPHSYEPCRPGMEGARARTAFGAGSRGGPSFLIESGFSRTSDLRETPRNSNS